MNKFGLIIASVFIFLIVTAMAVSYDNPNYGRKVQFTNVSFAIRNSTNEIVNVTTSTPTTSTVKFIEKQTTAPDTKTLTNTEQYTLKNDLNTFPKEYDTSKITYKNTDNTKYDKNIKKASNTKINTKREYGEYIPKYKTVKDAINTPSYQDEDEYIYDNIDWSRWKSNFVNRILDDSMEIHELDNYPNGAFFYYSFTVDSLGNITNINVRSVYLSERDKQLVKKLIKSYAHRPITKFPKNTHRKTAKVSAIMMLSNSETNYSKPSDFNDTERVKYKR